VRTFLNCGSERKRRAGKGAIGPDPLGQPTLQYSIHPTGLDASSDDQLPGAIFLAGSSFFFTVKLADRHLRDRPGTAMTGNKRDFGER
jgi:hypothetical protein